MPISDRIPSPARSAKFWWVAFAAWFVLLFVLSSMSSVPASAPVFMWSDKFAHAAYFTTGSAALFWALALPAASRLRSKPMLMLLCCVSAAALVGAFDEWHQSHTPGRSGNDIGDWIADIAGGVLGYLLGIVGLPALRR